MCVVGSVPDGVEVEREVAGIIENCAVLVSLRVELGVGDGTTVVLSGKEFSDVFSNKWLTGKEVISMWPTGVDEIT